MDIVITDKDLEELGIEGKKYSRSEFIKEASQEINLDGDILADVDILDKQFYKALESNNQSDTFNIKYFSTNRDSVPDYIDAHVMIISNEPPEPEEVEEETPKINPEEVFPKSVLEARNEDPVAKAVEEQSFSNVEETQEPEVQEVAQETQPRHASPNVNHEAEAIKAFEAQREVPADIDSFNKVVNDVETKSKLRNSEFHLSSIEALVTENKTEDDIESKQHEDPAYVYVFGSGKGGVGKTFTCIISAYRYAKLHPYERIAVVDIDVIDGQVGITIHQIVPTLYRYYKEYENGDTSFHAMSKSIIKNPDFPGNIDFYLPPRDKVIQDQGFWDSVCLNLLKNYDVVFFDTAIDYMGYEAVSNIYKIADKITLLSTTSIKSVSSVVKQAKRLKGETENDVYSKELNLADKLQLVVTQVDKNDSVSELAIRMLSDEIDIVTMFGNLNAKIQRAEYYGEWNIFDDHQQFMNGIDLILEG